MSGNPANVMEAQNCEQSQAVESELFEEGMVKINQDEILFSRIKELSVLGDSTLYFDKIKDEPIEEVDENLKLWYIKSEEIIIKNEAERTTTDFFEDQKLMKIEKNDESNHIIFDDENIKHRGIEIKNEDITEECFFEQGETSISTNYFGQEYAADLVAHPCNVQSVWQEDIKGQFNDDAKSLVLLNQHRNLEDADIFECTHSDFQTVYREDLNIHMCKLKNVEKANRFKCIQCNCQTVHKRDLKSHLLTHKNPSEEDLFKCSHCDFQTIHNFSLRRHMLRHKSPDEIDLFKCSHCDFQTIHNRSLRRHMLRHKNPDEVDLFKCTQCDFQTVHKKSLSHHMLRHKIPGEVDMFRCSQCDFQTIHNGNLRRHMLRHKNPD